MGLISKEQLPKVERYEKFLAGDSKAATFTVVAKQFGFSSARKLRGFLQKQGVLYKNKIDGVYPARAGFDDCFETTYFRQESSLETIISPTLKFTPKGIDLVYNLTKEGVVNV